MGVCEGESGDPADRSQRLAIRAPTWQSPHIQTPDQARLGDDRGTIWFRHTGRYTGKHLQAGWIERREAVSDYAVVYERTPAGWGAYCPDLPGLGIVASSHQEAKRLIHDGVHVHVESLREHGDSVPQPVSTVGVVSVAMP